MKTATSKEVQNGPMLFAVVGAGAAGLSAAWRLLDGQHQVVVFERRAVPGGRMRTEWIDGIGVDTGVQLIGSNYTVFGRLLESLGVRQSLVRSPGRDALWRRSRAHPLNYGSIASLIVSSALPSGLKLRLGAKYLPFLTHYPDLDLHDLLVTGGLALDDESIASWGARELGDDFVDLLVYPLLGAYYGSSPEQTSPALYHALSRVALDVSVLTAAGGMAALALRIADALASRGVSLRYSTPIERIELDREGVLLHDPSGAQRYDGLVLAVPAPEALRLLGNQPVSDWLVGVRAPPTCTLALTLERPLDVDYFGLSFARESGPRTVVALCVQERKGSQLVPEGKGALLALPVADRAPSLAELAPQELLERMLPDVERVLPGTKSSLMRARATYFPEGNPVFYPGYYHHLHEFSQRLLPERVALAGDYLVAPTVEGAARSGIAAAESLLGV